MVKDQSTDFNYYTKRFSLISVYLKILCAILLKEKFKKEDIQKEVSKTLEQLKHITKLKPKFSIFEDIQKFFSQFKTQQGRGF
jgi:ubiquinone biosynthesis protein COQ9